MSYRLLLADDSLTIQKVVELVLANEDFEIKAVNDGETAYGLVSSFNPHIILADIDMPQLNGYQLCQKVKGSPATAHIPVILLAGAFEPFDEEYSREVGADDSIIKPFESQELISKVKALIANVVTPAAEVEASAPENDSFDFEEDFQASEPTSIDELKWESDVANLTAEAAEAETDEDIAAFKNNDDDFKDVLSEVLRSKSAEDAELAAEPQAIFTRQDSGAVASEQIERNITAMFNSDLLPSIKSSVKESVEKMVSSSAPEIITNVTKELVIDLLPDLRSMIEAQIRKSIPEIAERIITKEIEKIKSGS
ncbi:MAG: response regulator [Nitrospirae bacterium]|nr:response regulator [Nitrospirota bacterium]